MSVLLSALLCFAVMLAAWWPGRRERDPRWAAAVAFGAAVLGSFVLVTGWWRLDPAEIARLGGELLTRRRASWQSPALLAAVATVLGATASAPRLSAGVAAMIIAPATAVAAALIIHPPEAAAHPLLGRPLLALIVLALWLGLDPFAASRRGAALPLATTIAAAAAAFILLESRNASLAVAMAGFGAAGAAALVVAWINPRTSLSRGGVTVIAAVLPALLVVGAWHDYGELPALAFPLAAAAPLAVWVERLPALRRLPAWQRTSAAALATTAACAPAMTWVTLGR